MKWISTDVLSPIGLQDAIRGNPNGCKDILNLDPRVDTLGTLGIKPKVEAFLSAPTDATITGASDLGYALMYSTLWGGGVKKEINILVQKGTINRVSGSGASVTTRNGIIIWNYPAYIGGVWYNQWNWLNKMIITKITNVDSGYIINVYGGLSQFDTPPVIYNVTKNEYATILQLVGAAPEDLYLSVTGWTTGDTVIIMSNHFPLANDLSNYSAVTAEVNFHNIINDLRIGFGGYSGRLGMGIGYRKKYFDIGSVESNNSLLSYAQNLDNLILDPHNIETTSGTFLITPSISVTNAVGNPFPYSEVQALFLKVGVVLDGTNEFLIKPVATNSEIGDGYAYALYGGAGEGSGSNYLSIIPKIRFATVNKRITHLRFYVAIGNGSSTGFSRTSPYYLCKEVEVSNYESAGSTWKLDADGFLVPNVTGSNISINYDQFKGNLGAIQDVLNYKSSYNYVNSWDGAIISQGKAFYLNGYVDQRYVNKIFISEISGDGVPMYDVATVIHTSDANLKNDGDVIGIELLSNNNIAVFKQNSILQFSPDTESFTDTVIGVGCTSRRGIVNFKDRIIFPSQNGIYLFDGVRAVNISEGFIQTSYMAISDKTALIATKDELGNTYRFCNVGREYLFTEKFGWFKFYNGDTIVQYQVSSEDNLIRYLTSTGAIKKVTSTRAIDYGTGSTDTILLDTVDVIPSMEPRMSAGDFFLMGYFWMRYKSPREVTIKIYLDYNTNNPITITAPINTTGRGYIREPLKRGVLCQTYSIRITSALISGDTGFEIYGRGIHWVPRRAGNWDNSRTIGG